MGKLRRKAVVQVSVVTLLLSCGAVGVTWLSAKGTRLDALRAQAKAQGLMTEPSERTAKGRDVSNVFRDASGRFKMIEATWSLPDKAEWYDPATPANIPFRASRLASMEPELARIRAAVNGHLKLRLEPEQIVWGECPEMPGLMKASSWLCRTADAAAFLGRYEDAVAEVQCLTQLARLCNQTGTTTGDNARIILTRRIVGLIARLLSVGDWPPDQLRALARSLDTLEEPANIRSALQEQTRNQLWISDNLGWLLSEIGSGSCGYVPWYEHAYGRSAVAKAEYQTRALEALLQIESLRRDGEIDTLDGYRRAMVWQRKAEEKPLPSMSLESFIPYVGECVRGQLMNRCRIALAKAYVAVKLAKVQGQAPTGLPLNPFDGKPVQVRSTPKGFEVVCSVLDVPDSAALALEDLVLVYPDDKKVRRLY